MKLCFAEAYTLKEDNWAAEIIGYSAEQLPNNEPPGSCPKNKQDCLKERAPTEDGSLTGSRPTQTEARKDSPSGGAEISGRPRFSCKAIEAYKDSGIPCPPAAQAADIQRNTVSCCRPCFGLRILSPKEIAGTVPFAKEHSPISRRGDIRILRGDKKRSDLTI